MTKRDFFILLIKIFGLYSAVRMIFSVLPNELWMAVKIFDSNAFIWILISILAVIGLFLLLIFRAPSIVSALKLQNGFESEHIDLANLKAADVVRIACLVIGGLLIINNIPTLLSHTFYAFTRLPAGDRSHFFWLMSGLNILLGIVLIVYYEWVAKLFSRRSETVNE